MKDGVYLGLPHDVYLKASGIGLDGKPMRRMGSTDWTKLYARGRGWWWTSANNPYHLEKQTDATTFGSALHKLLLEGREAYTAAYAVMPNPNDYADLLVNAEDLRSALIAAGAPGIKAKMAKRDLVEMGKAYLDGRHIWDDIVERWERTLRGRTKLEAADAFAIEAMCQAALRDPEARVLCGADEEVRLSEVSILYTPEDGIPRRYRMDSLLPTANVDLKSFVEWRAGAGAEWAIGDLIAKNNLDVQLAMSHEARVAAYKLIEAGLVFHVGEDVETAKVAAYDGRTAEAWLKRFPKEAPLNAGKSAGWCFAWMFYQKPEGGQAPELIPVRVFYGDDLHRSGFRKYRTAMETFQVNLKQFGLSKPWTGVSQLYDTSARYTRRIVVPAFGDAPRAVAGEEEAMSWR